MVQEETSTLLRQEGNHGLGLGPNLLSLKDIALRPESALES